MDFFLEVVTRRGCLLCHEGEQVVADVARTLAVPVRTVDVDGDPELVARYGDRVPVVLSPDGRPLAEGVIRRWPLTRAILMRRLRRWGPV